MKIPDPLPYFLQLPWRDTRVMSNRWRQLSFQARLTQSGNLVVLFLVIRPFSQPHQMRLLYLLLCLPARHLCPLVPTIEHKLDPATDKSHLPWHSRSENRSYWQHFSDFFFCRDSYWQHLVVGKPLAKVIGVQITRDSRPHLIFALFSSFDFYVSYDPVYRDSSMECRSLSSLSNAPMGVMSPISHEHASN